MTLNIPVKGQNDPPKNSGRLGTLSRPFKQWWMFIPTLLGDTLIWRCENAFAKTSIPVGQRQGFSATFSKGSLFEHKPWLQS